MPAEFIVKLAGTKQRPPDELIIESSLHHPDSVEVRWTDQPRAMLNNVQIGSPLTIEGTAGQTAALKIAEVEVTALEAVLEGGVFFSVVRGLDKTHRLHRGTLSKTYPEMKASDIVSDLASKVGVTTDKVDATSVTYEAYTQFNETPWDFLRRLGAESNRTVTVSKEGKLSFTSPAGPADAPSKDAKDDRVLSLRRNVQHLHATLTSAQQVAEVEVRGWDPATQKALNLTKASKSVTSKVDKGHTPDKLVTKFGKAKHTLIAPEMKTQARVNSMAAALGERLGSGMIEIHGEVLFNPKLRAGVAVTLVDAGPHFDGKYILSAVRHVHDKLGGARTEFTIAGNQDRSLAGIIAGADGNGGGSGRFWGVYPAVVTNNKDDKSKEARIKVAYPWLSDTKVESGWARVVHTGASKDRGLFVLPNVNDEVLVAFMNGDPSRPIVIGGLYNEKAPPFQKFGKASGDISKGGKTNQVSLTSEKTGLQLIDADGSSKQTVTLGTRDSKFVITLTSDKNGLVQIVSDGKVEVTSKSDITIQSKTGKVSISGKEVDIQAKMSLKAAGATAELGGKTSTKIGGASINIG